MHDKDKSRGRLPLRRKIPEVLVPGVLFNPTPQSMKQFFKMFFASLVAIIIGGILSIGILIGIIINAATQSKTEKNDLLKSGPLLVIETDKRLHEQGEKNSFSALSKDISYTAGLYDAIQAIHAAKDDKSIKGIVLKLEGSANGWATT